MRNAVAALGIFAGMAVFALGFVEVDEAADEEVEAAIVVVVEPDRARGPSGSGHAGLFGYVGEGAVAIVAIEDAFAVLGDVEIGKAVAVVVAHGHALTEAACAHAGFLRYISESSVAI